MLEDLLVVLALSTVLASVILLARLRRKLRIAREHREHLRALIGLPSRMPALGASGPGRWRERWRLRQSSR